MADDALKQDLDQDATAGDEQVAAIDAAEDECEIIELEYSEDQIEYYIEDEEGVELGFAIKEDDGSVVEYYYEDNADEYEEAPAAPKPSKDEPRDQRKASTDAHAVKGSSSKATNGANQESLAYMAGNAAVKLRSKAEKAPDKISEAAKKAAPNVKKNELKEAASDLNDIYKTGKEVGGELKAVYDDLTGMLDFLPKSPKSKLRKFGRR